MMAAAGTTAGATLVPMVMNAQITAAKTDRICVRAYCVMLITFEMPRIIPAIQTTLHSMCQNEYKYKYQYFSSISENSLYRNNCIYWEIMPIFGSDEMPIAA